MKIKDWVKTDEALRLELVYKQLCFIDEDSSWDDFKFVESKKAYETYKCPTVKEGIGWDAGEVELRNVVYSTINKDMMSNLWMSLRIAASAIKIEGCSPSGGQLIVQERNSFMDMAGVVDDRWKDVKCRLLWRGIITRIAPGCEKR